MHLNKSLFPFFFFCLLETGFHYVAPPGQKFSINSRLASYLHTYLLHTYILLPLCPKYWDYRHIPPCLAFVSCIPTNWKDFILWEDSPSLLLAALYIKFMAQHSLQSPWPVILVHVCPWWTQRIYSVLWPLLLTLEVFFFFETRFLYAIALTVLEVSQ